MTCDVCGLPLPMIHKDDPRHPFCQRKVDQEAILARIEDDRAHPERRVARPPRRATTQENPS